MVKKFRRRVSWSKSREEGVESSVMFYLSNGNIQTSNVLMKNIFVLLHLKAPQRDLTAKKQFHLNTKTWKWQKEYYNI